MTPPRLRPAAADDVDRLLALEERVFPGDRLDRRAFRHAVRSRSMAVLVAEGPDGFAGYAILETRRGARVARLSSVATEPEAAGRGIGRALLAACETEAMGRGCDRLRLEVRADNARAVALYERAGYRRLAVVAEYYEDGAAAIRFERTLEP